MTKRFIFFICTIIFLQSSIHLMQAQDLETRLQEMPLQEKISQMFVMSFYGSTLNEPARNFLAEWKPGSVVFLPSNIETPEQITRLTNDIQETLIQNNGIPAFIAVDQEGGIIAHLEEGFTRWPVPTLLTATQNPQLAYEFGMALAGELRAVGINMNLAPVADLLTNRDNPIIGRRSFGNNPEQVTPILSAVIEGMQAGGVLATAKHFPGHGATDTDSHITLPQLPLDQTELENRELIPFQAAISSHVGAIMVAHIAFPNIQADPDLPASLSDTIVTQLLREELQFDGLIMTDAMDMDAIDTTFSPEQAAIQAIHAGNDLLILGAHISPERQASAIQAVMQAVVDGAISEEQVEESVRRILIAKEHFGILEWEPLNPNSARERIDQTTHGGLVQQMFVEGITLVRGEDLLSADGDVAFIYPASRPALWNTCQNNQWRPLGVSTYPTDEEIAWARQIAQSVDLVLVGTTNAYENTYQQKLVAALPEEKTMVIALQSPFDILSFPSITGYIVTYSPLEQANEAICAILQGRLQASGNLSVQLD